MTERLARIRESERKSHTAVYANEKLYQSDSWLQRPIKTVREIIPYFSNSKELRILDLGCGVGRNSIYIAEQYRHINCSVDCVDFLDIAIAKLLENAAEHNVSDFIRGITKSIEEYTISKNTYDLIMAISALEHVDSQDSFFQKMFEIKNGVKENGIICLIINSSVTELCLESNTTMEAQFEVNLPTESMQSILNDVFGDWEILKASVVVQQYDVPREAFTSRLNSNVITYVARKSK